MRKLSIDEAVKLGVTSKGEKKSSQPWIPRVQASGPDGRQFNWSRKRIPSPTVSEEEKEGIRAPSSPVRKRRATMRSEESSSTSPIATRRSPTAGTARYGNGISESPSKISPVRKSVRPNETRSARRSGTGLESRRASCSTNTNSATGYVPTSGNTSACVPNGGSSWDIPVFKFSPTESVSRPTSDVSSGKVRSTFASSKRLQEALIGDEQACKTSDIITSTLKTLKGQPPATAKARPKTKPHLSLDTTNIPPVLEASKSS